MKKCGFSVTDEDGDLNASRFLRFAILAAAGGITAALLIACRDKPEIPRYSRGQSSFPYGRKAIQSVAHLGDFLVPGMSTNDIIAKWGRPDWEERESNGMFWRYHLSPFPADDDMRGTHVVGVIVAGS